MENKVPGVCPECGANIRAPSKLIEYETPEEKRIFAECPECGDIVHPE